MMVNPYLDQWRPCKSYQGAKKPFHLQVAAWVLTNGEPLNPLNCPQRFWPSHSVTCLRTRKNSLLLHPCPLSNSRTNVDLSIFRMRWLRTRRNSLFDPLLSHSCQHVQYIGPIMLMILRMRWPRTRRNSLLPTAASAHAVAAAIALVESMLQNFNCCPVRMK